MGFTIEQKCPQCGAPIEFEETDRLIRCPYCDVENYLFAPGHFRFVLPDKASGKEIIYAPYLRFKGNVYFCQGQTVGYRIVDITRIGLPFKGIPVSLGLRPQAMKMKFMTGDTEGSFLNFTLKAKDIISNAARLSSASLTGKIFHRAYIGETLSIIYLPLFVNNGRLFDAILNRPIYRLTQGQDISELTIKKKPQWKIHFIATLCPQCGWNLEGERDSVVLNCNNCDSAWEVSKGKFVRVNLLFIEGQGKETVYLPFWKIRAKVKGLEINSYGDFMRQTNQPRVPQKKWENQAMYFWSPAFKIRPKVFLRLSSQVTVSQTCFKAKETIHRKDLYPVTLPGTEAIQGLKIVLAGSAINKEKVLPLLPSIKFDIKELTLAYLPFTDARHEMVQQHIGISINKNTLNYGRYL
ncbi:MAG: hypothetical protein U9R17_10345 [Thermodesulfobacteriota bacterium]|nr:hypothetical protein [Thermodesulfobacteriota bacterium]